MRAFSLLATMILGLETTVTPLSCCRALMISLKSSAVRTAVRTSLSTSSNRLLLSDVTFWARVTLSLTCRAGTAGAVSYLTLSVS